MIIYDFIFIGVLSVFISVLLTVFFHENPIKYVYIVVETEKGNCYWRGVYRNLKDADEFIGGFPYKDQIYFKVLRREIL